MFHSQLVLYALKLGSLGFGGPVALVGYMHRDLVVQRNWVSEADYKDGLALAQLAPGPLAAQLAIYLGYVRYRVLGATLVGLAFVLPSFFMVVAIGWAYVRFGGLPWMQAVFYGVGVCVIGIIANSAIKLTKRTLGSDRLLWGIYLVSALTTAITETEIAWMFFVAGALAWIVKTPPTWLSGSRASSFAWPLAIVGFAEPAGILWKMFWFFTKAGAFVFGSGLAIVPFLHSGVVKDFQWLNEQQFIDAVAVAMITPGPVVITVGFIGYLIAGFPGACVAALGTFLPCYLFTVIPAPYFKKYSRRPDLHAFVNGVTAAAVGTIAGAVIVLGRRSIIDLPTGLLGIATLLLCWKVKKIPEPVLVIAAALIGLALKR